MKLKELNAKLEQIDAMLSDEELYLLQGDYDRLLEIAESKTKSSPREVQRLHGMVCFLSAWKIIKLDKRGL